MQTLQIAVANPLSHLIWLHASGLGSAHSPTCSSYSKSFTQSSGIPGDSLSQNIKNSFQIQDMKSSISFAQYVVNVSSITGEQHIILANQGPLHLNVPPLSCKTSAGWSFRDRSGIMLITGWLKELKFSLFFPSNTCSTGKESR